jgi:hypothetical protein
MYDVGFWSKRGASENEEALNSLVLPRLQIPTLPNRIEIANRLEKVRQRGEAEEPAGAR